MVALGVLSGGMRAQEHAPAAAGPGTALVDRFEFRYGLADPVLPPVAALDRVTVVLTRSNGVWHAAAGAKEGEELTLGGVPADSRFSSDALTAVAQAVVKWYNARGIYGVWVAFTQLESSGGRIVDRRPPGDHTARMVVWASQVSQVRTLARGSRFKPKDSIDNPKHRWIIADSPLKPGAKPGEPGSLFLKNKLENYLRALSLQPGRRVEASIESAGKPGEVVLDYLVNEEKPWQLFSQVTNTGTDTTGKWRIRLGFQDTELTNHDDILNVDAISTPDRKTYGTFLSYRIPLLRPARLLARVYGSYGDYLANVVSLVGLRFAGRNWLGGVEFSNYIPLGRGWELNTLLGARYVHYDIQSEISGFTLGQGYSNFLIPYLSPIIKRDAGWWSLSGALRLDSALNSISNKDPNTGVTALGRIGADSKWTSLRWNVDGALYLDPLFEGGPARAKHLANEIAFRMRGRYLLNGKRLVPQEEEPIGGYYTVRGYPDSVLAADEFVTGSVEYAFHLPRILKPGEPGKLFGHPFKWRPPQRQQRADWDLIFRTFFDYGYRQVTPLPSTSGQASNSGSQLALIDRNVSLAGAGVGVELVVGQNFSMRADYGMALIGLRDDSRPVGQQIVVPKGNKQVYLIGTFAW